MCNKFKYRLLTGTIIFISLVSANIYANPCTERLSDELDSWAPVLRFKSTWNSELNSMRALGDFKKAGNIAESLLSKYSFASYDQIRKMINFLLEDGTRFSIYYPTYQDREGWQAYAKNAGSMTGEELADKYIYHADAFLDVLRAIVKVADRLLAPVDKIQLARAVPIRLNKIQSNLPLYSHMNEPPEVVWEKMRRIVFPILRNAHSQMSTEFYRSEAGIE